MGFVRRSQLSAYLTAGVAVTGAGLIPIPPVHPAPNVHEVLLTSVELGPLGDGTALLLGGSGYPVPSQGYLEAFNANFLAPLGYTGTNLVPVTTPESLYPFVPPGPFAATLNSSMATGEQIIEKEILSRVASGEASPEHPLVVTGYSQSSIMDATLMKELAGKVPTEDLRFVLLGNENNPNGGFLERFDLPAGSNPTAESLGITFNGAMPSDLFPTDNFTDEYDGFADFPKYPINLLADINAYLGILFNHIAYLGVTPEQATPEADGGDAILLPTSAVDTMVNYYMIPTESLPLVDLLRLVPFVGNPLADLVQPDLFVLVNLGYGNVDDTYLGGWDHGPADVGTTMGFLPPQSVLDQVPEALVKGLQQGVQDMFKDLANPSNYQLISPQTMHEFLGPIVNAATAAFDLDKSPSEMSSWFNSFLTSTIDNYKTGLTELSFTHTGIPPIDVASTLLFTLPKVAEEMFQTQMAAGNPVDAVGDPLAAVVGLLPILAIGALGL
ncbi:PE-PPE domain-containing protein [Mycobacterium sp. M1]|uniref:PE-PPE domain-containing protein n=1 Tax=Mycolicibacter acidiphilus TaxID=2835306 RepID=A0ABS5RNV3_9MYCO|nr:PE-PPE domain-containing protein [Mycolicibacter acidiphilus]MBS9535874.1 PE-PPE domain-containing protein [Mycolicibacter acidiphilus]